MVLREDVDVVHNGVGEVLALKLGPCLKRILRVPAELARINRDALATLKVVVGAGGPRVSPRQLLVGLVCQVCRAPALIPHRLSTVP